MLQFAKGSAAGDSPVRTPDTMTSDDTIELLLGIGEGPCLGLPRGPKDFYLDGTALVNESGVPNFSNFALQYWPGNELGHTIKLELGGFSNPINYGVTLTKDIPVTRTGVTTGIDALDFRIVVQQLYKQDDKGIFTTPLSIKFEVKKHANASWQPAWFSDASNLDTPSTVDSGQLWQGFGSGGGADANQYTFDGDRQLIGSGSNPTLAPDDPNAIHVNTTDNTIWSWGGATWTAETTTGSGAYQVMSDGTRLYASSGGVAPTGTRVGDLWMAGIASILAWNGASWVKGSIPAQYVSSEIPENGVWTIDAKVTANTPKDLRVFLPPDLTDTWEFRVTKLSADSDTEIVSTVVWESVQEIKRSPMTFKGVTMARIIGRASDQFTSIPNLSADYCGRIVKVPSNYNTETRVYTGIWDGTYQLKWTTNTAFIFQDFVENERYGLSSVFPQTVNKWRIYEWAQNCDTMVGRPDGSLRPRWTFNDYIQTPRDAKEQANYIAGSAGARYIDDGNGVVDIMIDQDEDAVALFTRENVSEAGFAYSYSDRLTRANEVVVEFINPNLTWQADKRVVRDEDDIATYGVISDNFIAVGCTDEDEALARARRRLIIGLTEKEIVNFTTNRKGRFLSEMDVILVADPNMGRGLTGRIHAKTSSTSVSLRDSITFEGGFTYFAVFEIVTTTLETVRIPITNGAGATKTITFGATLPTLPEYATFAIECEGLVGVPKPYRILNIDDQSGSGETIAITALELNRDKWDYIDTGVSDGDIDYGSVGKEVDPPTNLRVVTSIRQKGLTSTRVATLIWTKSPSKFVRQYKVFHTLDGVAVEGPAPMPQTSCEFEGIASGEHVFTVVAVDLFGRESRAAVLRYNTNGVMAVNGQFNLRLVNGTANVFNEAAPVVEWDAITLTPDFDHYEILVLGALSMPLRVINVGQALTWTYPHDLNNIDHSNDPPRNLVLALRAVDQWGNSSDPDTLSITNPAPAAPTGITLTIDGDGWIVNWNSATGADFGGTRIQLNGVQVFEGPGNQARIPLSASGTYTVRVGHFDTYKPSETVWATAVTSSLTKLIQDTIDELTTAVEAGATLIESLSTELDPAMRAVLELTLRVDEIRDRLNVRTMKNQKTVGSLIQQLQTLREEDQEASAEFQTVLGAWSEDHQSWILDLLKVKAGPTETFAQMLTRLEASDATNSASVTSEQNARIAGDLAEAVSRNALATTVGTLSSTVTSEISARTSADTATAQRLDRFIVENGGLTAAVLNDTYVKIASSGLSIATTLSGLITTDGANTAAIASEASTRTTQYGSISSSVSTLSTTVGGLTSSVTTLQSAVNGIGANWALALDVNGFISGLTLNNNGSTSSAKWLVTTFLIVDPNSGSPFAPFSYSGGVIRMTNVYLSGGLLVDGTITTTKIVGGAVSNLDASFSAPSLALTTSAATAHTRSITSDGGAHTIAVVSRIANSGADIGLRMVLKRNGTYIDEDSWHMKGLFSTSGSTVFYDTPGAGTHTYTVELNLTSGSGVSASNLSNKMISTELKK